MTWLGGQSRQYFMNLLKFLGWDTSSVDIQEFAPFMAGVSECGDTRSLADYQANRHYRWYIGPEEQRFYWTFEPGNVGLNWFRAGSGQAGVDHHLEPQIPEEIACLLQRWKPAQTELVPDFGSLPTGSWASDPMQGTP
jgi:uncharacterized protein YmfQ (DUF2313 family)